MNGGGSVAVQISEDLGSLEVTPVEDAPFVYNFSIAGFNSNSDDATLAFLLILEEQTNRTAFRRMSVGGEVVNFTSSGCSTFRLSYVVDADLTGEPQQPSFMPFAVGPEPPANVQSDFTEDFSYIRRAILNVSWDAQPSVLEDESICALQLTMEVAPDERKGRRWELCQMQAAYTTVLDKNATKHSISARAGVDSDPPIFDCNYHLEIKYLPGGRTHRELVKIRYTGPNSELALSCHPFFDPLTLTYSIEATWTVSNPLAVSAMPNYDIRLFYVARLGGHLRFISNTSRTIPERRTLYTGLPHFNNSRALYRLSVMVFGLMNSNPFAYRQSLLPNRKDQVVCLIPAPKVKPLPVRNISVTNLRLVSNRNDYVYKFDAHWVPPQFINAERLLEYEIQILDPDMMKTFLPQRVPPNLDTLAMELRFSKVENIPDILNLQIRGQSNLGLLSDWSEVVEVNLTGLIPREEDTTTTATTSHSPATSSSRHFPAYGIALIVVGVLVAVVVAVLIIFVVLRILHWRRFKDTGDGNSKNDSIVMLMRTNGSIGSWPMHKRIQPVFSFDPWEVQQGELTIFEEEPLGKGCYGEVYKGLLSGRRRRYGSKRGVATRAPRYSLANTVAVKKLQKNATSMEKSNFLKEIETMKSVSKVENELSKFVVNMLGCVITREPMILVLEYMEYGNLLDYLRSTRMKNQPNLKPAPYLEPKGAYSELAPGEEKYKKLETLEMRHLLEFARQIAAGMEHLSSLGIIHRDLACRNILVGENRNLKISDFGMSRFLLADEVYINTSHGLLPIRWMSVESLFRREFTSASDVWSYGVVLWEICTLGGYPYHNYANKDIAPMLRKGFRMRKPDNCSQDIYDVMLYCWSEDAEDRPKFGELHKLFDRFLGIHIQDRYPYIELQSQPYRFDRLAPETGQGADDGEEQGEETPLNLSDTEEEGFAGPGVVLKLSPVPPMSRSKLSMLSSSTVHLELDGEKEEVRSGSVAEEQHSVRTTDDDHDGTNNPSPDNNKDPAHCPHHHNSYENTVEVAGSSFRKELMCQFERRLSDLGPRNKYPYLQRIDQQHSAVATDSLETASQSDEVLSSLPREGQESTWWKYYAELKAARAAKRQRRGNGGRGDGGNGSAAVHCLPKRRETIHV